MKFDPAWERPVKAVRDHFNLDDVTIIGASLGGYLASRAAAFEKRITKVIGWSIFPDFFDILLADDPKALRIIMDSMYRHGHAGVFKIFGQGFSVIQSPRGIALLFLLLYLYPLFLLFLLYANKRLRMCVLCDILYV